MVQAVFALAWNSSWSYYKAYYGTLVSYALILYKAHGIPKLNMQYAQKVFMDENSQYFIMAIIWVSGVPLRATLLPYALFSLFHALTYIRTEFIPKLFPGHSVAKSIGDRLAPFVQTYQPKAIWAVARIELWLVLPFTFIGIFWGASLFTPFLYCQFLSFRYLLSAQTKQAVKEMETKFDGWILNTGVPEWGKQTYKTIKNLVKQYGDLEARARAAQPK